MLFMEKTDMEIMQNLLAQRIGKVVAQVVGKVEALDEDIHIDVDVNTPSCYADDNGMIHTGRLITVCVAFAREEDIDED